MTTPINESEANEMHREWRAEIRADMAELRNGQKQIAETLSKLTTRSELNSVAQRVTALEGDKAKIVGGLVVLQAIGSFFLWFFTRQDSVHQIP